MLEILKQSGKKLKEILNIQSKDIQKAIEEFRKGELEKKELSTFEGNNQGTVQRTV